MGQSGFRMRAKFQRDAFFAQAERLRAKLAFGVCVRRRYRGTVLSAKARRSNTGARQSDDQNVLAAQLESARHLPLLETLPATSTFWRSQKLGRLPQFKRRQRKQREDQRDDPE